MSVTEYGLKWIVALRKESVDRNGRIMNVSNGLKRSLSARRAWIEIFKLYLGGEQNKVALRKESVDRNHRLQQRHAQYGTRRSPQGERG